MSQNSAGSGYGGGVTCVDSSPSLINCEIGGNATAMYAGGVYCYGSSPVFAGCTITGNFTWGIDSDGGGIGCRNYSSPTFVNCVISANSVGRAGGGVHCEASSPTFTSCSIAGNSAGVRGGGLDCGWNSAPILTNCTISGNTAISGGGVYCEGVSPIFTHCIFGGNSAGTGGGVYCEGTSPIFNSTTIAFSQGSGIYFKNSAGSQVLYSDIYGNSAGDIVFFSDDPIHGPAAIGHISTTNANGDPCDTYYNIFLNPSFVNPPTGDMHLNDDSPCIGAADPTYPPPLDMDGNPRPNPPGSNPDIGAYENAHGMVYPNLGYMTLLSPGPTDWGYRLHWISGSLSRLVFTNFCEGTIGSVGGNAEAAGWTVTNYSDSVVFTTSTPLTSGTIDTFWLSHPYCSDVVTWTAGDSSGTIEGPLPVELTAFEAIAGDGQVTLRWRTESELDNDHFLLYKRKAGEEDFRKLSEIPGHGTTTEPHDYEYVDRWVQNGLTYEYRISDVDITGRETIHEQIVSATPARNATPLDFALHPNHPNPFNPTTTIRYDVKQAGQVRLTIFNLLGQEVARLVDGRQVTGSHTISWDAADLPSGIYLCRMEAEGFQETRKVMLLK